MSEKAITPVLEALRIAAVVLGDRGETRVLDGVSIGVEAGCLVDVVGESGSGKTTLLRALARLLPCAEGDLRLEGVPAHDIAPDVWRRRVALLPQRPALVPGDVAANLLLPWTLKARHAQAPPSREELRAALDSLGLEDVGLDRDVVRLSVGQLARIAFGRTLLTHPQVLLLDEPDAALDETSSGCVTRATAGFVERGGAVVRVRHRAGDGLAGRRLRLEAGRLAEVAP